MSNCHDGSPLHVRSTPARAWHLRSIEPGQRARLARFDGSFEGENLFQSDRPQAPEKVMRSWWASDRHRYVLFAGRPDSMGLDPGGGTHWALMTGRLN